MTDPALSPAECAAFHRDGFFGPFTVLEPEAMDALRPRLLQDLGLTSESNAQPTKLTTAQARHLDLPSVLELGCSPAIVDRVAALLGEDLILMQSNFFIKYPGTKEIPWHQDLNYWDIEPPVAISCWLAIDDVDTDNACVDLIPGSHRRFLPHVRAGEEHAFGQRADPDSFDADQRVRMRLRPGEGFLFTERLLHHSDANPARRRMGLALRYTLPQVRVGFDQPMILVSGQDHFGFNETAEPAAFGVNPAAIRASTQQAAEKQSVEG